MIIPKLNREVSREAFIGTDSNESAFCGAFARMSMKSLKSYSKSLLAVALLGGSFVLSQAEIVPLDLSGGFNYDGYITDEEADHALLYSPPSSWSIGSRLVSVVFTEHAAGSYGRAYAWADQAASGLPVDGEITTGYGDFQLSTSRDAEPGGGFVLQPTGSPPVLPLASNVLRASRPHSGSTSQPNASVSVTLPGAQQVAYDSINFLVSGDNGKVLIYADYDDGSGGIDQQLIYESNGPGGAEDGFPEVVSSSSSNADLVAAITMSNYWGQSSNYSNISSGTATLWTFEDPIALDSSKILKGLTLSIYNADTWNARSAVIYAASANTAKVTYHVDEVNGSDTTGDGSSGNPFETIGHVLPLLTGGEDVILYDGSYGNVTLDESGNIYPDWVTFKAASGQSPELNRFVLNGPSGPSDQTGGYNAYVRLEGLIIRDGFKATGAKHWAIYDCLIERIGPYTGNTTNMEKVGVDFRNGTDITIENTEITNIGIGVLGRGHEVVIRGCEIHGGSNDGIRVTGFWDSLIEANVIHSFDDGVTDAEAAWSQHCDLIHIYIPGPGTAGMENKNLTIRRNILYDTEAQGIQFNNYYATEDVLHNKNIIIENNIFGPTQSNVINNGGVTEGLIVRNNTIVYVPGGRTFGRWTLNNFNVRIGPGTDIEIYNNILHTVDIDTNADIDIFDWNILGQDDSPSPVGVDNARAYGRFMQINVDAELTDPEAFDGALDATSPAINAGTVVFAPSSPVSTDLWLTARDNRPDMGAWEKPGQSPSVEPEPTIYNDTKTIFVDDFEDGHYNDVDDWLNDVGQQGLSWHRLDPADYKFYVQLNADLSRNALIAPTGTTGQQRVGWLFTDQGSDWAEYDLTFNAYNAYLPSGSGPLLLAQDEDNCYWLDIGRDTGRLVRIMGGTSTVLATDADLEMPHSGAQAYKVSVRQVSGGIEFSVDVGDNGSVEFTYTDTNSTAVSTFTAGGIGVHDDTSSIYTKINYDDFRVEVISFN